MLYYRIGLTRTRCGGGEIVSRSLIVYPARFPSLHPEVKYAAVNLASSNQTVFLWEKVTNIGLVVCVVKELLGEERCSHG
jgi:hypothetical protein